MCTFFFFRWPRPSITPSCFSGNSTLRLVAFGGDPRSSSSSSSSPLATLSSLSSSAVLEDDEDDDDDEEDEVGEEDEEEEEEADGGGAGDVEEPDEDEDWRLGVAFVESACGSTMCWQLGHCVSSGVDTTRSKRSSKGMYRRG